MEEDVGETGFVGEPAGLGTAGEATIGLPSGLVFVSSGVAGTPGHLSNQTEDCVSVYSELRSQLVDHVLI